MIDLINFLAKCMKRVKIIWFEGDYNFQSLASRFVFSSNPRGLLKLWKLSDPLTSATSGTAETYDVSLLAEFSSCFGMRIMCVDASVEDEVISVSIISMFL